MSDIMQTLVQRDRRPLAAQVRDGIAEAIRTGELRPGEQMPGEHELAERFAVGRSTLREALRLLERDGLVDVFHGRGRFVSALAALHADRPVTEFESVTEMLEGLGYTVTNRVLRVEEAPASKEQALGLALKPGDPIVLLERLRLAGDKPLIYSVNAIDRRLIPGEVADHEWSGSAIALLGRLGARVISSTAAISAMRLPRAAAKLMGDRPGEPWLCVTESCVCDDGRAALYAIDYHRGENFAFNVIRRRSDDARPTEQRGR
jgi:GntR family transcriptional regulator